MEGGLPVSLIEVVIADERRVADHGIEPRRTERHIPAIRKKVGIDNRRIRDANAEGAESVSRLFGLFAVQFDRCQSLCHVAGPRAERDQSFRRRDRDIPVSTTGFERHRVRMAKRPPCEEVGHQFGRIVATA